MKNLANSAIKQGTVRQTGKVEMPERTKIDSVTLVYVPVYLGGPHKGPSLGPAAIRVAGVRERLSALGFQVAKEVEIGAPESACWLERGKADAKCLPELRTISLHVAQAVEAAMDAGTIPVTIGGDHTIAIGSIAGVSSYYRKRRENFGCAWFDAHADINTPATSGSGNVHGMPLAVALGHGDGELVKLLGHEPKLDSEKTALIGIRDVDVAEREMIIKTGIAAHTMRDIDRVGMGAIMDLVLTRISQDVAGLHISFDIDAMDPTVAPGVSTPASGGLAGREASLALTMLAQTGLLRSLDIAELNPARDLRGCTAELAIDLACTALGQRIL